MRHASRHRTGFTLLDLLIILALVICLGAFTTLLADNADTKANRVRCASNLRQIGQAILLYANENRGAYPRAAYDPEKADKPVAYTNPKPELTDEEKQGNVSLTFCKAGPAPDDMTAALFLLIKTEEITPIVFLCPSARGNATTQPSESPNPKTQCNFSEPGQLDYSLINVYPTDAAVDAGYKVNFQSPAEMAVAGDINPGVDGLLTTNSDADAEAMKKVNSPNHSGDGQNVLYADGHVEFDSNPFCGIDHDNIYTYGKSGPTSGGEGIIGSPSNEKDTILLPTAKQVAAKAKPQ